MMPHNNAKQCVSTKKVVTRLAHRKELKIEK